MPTSLVLGSFTPSVLLRVARRHGLLERYDLKVDEVAVPSSPAQFRSLLGGDLDVVLTNPDNVVAYRLCPDNPLGATADVKIVAGIDRGLGLGLYARSRLTLAALRSSIWGVDVPGSGFAFVLYALAESLGLAAGEYRVLGLGSTPRRLEALLAGRCDVTMLNAGNELRAEASGCHLLGRAADACRPYLGTVVAVAGDGHLDGARRLGRALVTAADRVLAGVADDDAADEAVTSLGLDRTLAERYVAKLKDPLEGLVGGGVVDAAALAAVIDLRRRYRPSVLDGIDVLAAARADPSGLVVPWTEPSSSDKSAVDDR